MSVVPAMADAVCGPGKHVVGREYGHVICARDTALKHAGGTRDVSTPSELQNVQNPLPTVHAAPEQLGVKGPPGGGERALTPIQMPRTQPEASQFGRKGPGPQERVIAPIQGPRTP
jgi:hypothetical protein